MAQTVYQIASSAALPARPRVLDGSSSGRRARRTAPSVTSALGLSRHRGGGLPPAPYPLAVVFFRSVGSAAVGFSCGSKNYRRHECAQVQRQLDRSAGTPVLAQATGNIVGELRAAVPADERRKQLLRGAGRLCAASFGLLDELRKGFISVAERGRFELPKLLRVCRFSRPVQSTALPPLRSGEFDHSFSFYQATGSVLHPGAPPPAVLAAVFSGIAFSPTAAGS